MANHKFTFPLSRGSVAILDIPLKVEPEDYDLILQTLHLWRSKLTQSKTTQSITDIMRDVQREMRNG